jgi:hypothetical protein
MLTQFAMQDRAPRTRPVRPPSMDRMAGGPFATTTHRKSFSQASFSDAAGEPLATSVFLPGAPAFRGSGPLQRGIVSLLSSLPSGEPSVARRYQTHLRQVPDQSRHGFRRLTRPDQSRACRFSVHGHQLCGVPCSGFCKADFSTPAFAFGVTRGSRMAFDFLSWRVPFHIRWFATGCATSRRCAQTASLEAPGPRAWPVVAVSKDHQGSERKKRRIRDMATTLNYTPRFHSRC